MSTRYRHDLPLLPFRMRDLPVDRRGYPVPWFATEVRHGEYDLRYADPEKAVRALREALCWICGKLIVRTMSFVVGPACVISRTTAEPGSHVECAAFAVQACPFLTQREVRRNTAPHDPAGELVAPPGIMNTHQPGVCVVWRARTASTFDDGSGGTLIKVGAPLQVDWYTAGRFATRDEALAGLARSYAGLLELAQQEGDDAVAQLAALHEQALLHLPLA
jgi:hypothetical protein